MANMSYCRFENTARDLGDCLDTLAEARDNFTTLAEFQENLSSDYERRGFDKLLAFAQELVELANSMEGEA